MKTPSHPALNHRMMLIHMPLPRRLTTLFVALGIQLAPLEAAEPRAGAVASNTTPRPIIGNLSPADALQAFETEPGFTVTLVAAEPLTIDPVALAFDERGRLFVAEDRDYPVGSTDGRPLGVIALLEDTDGDGRMDQRTDFATGIRFPNGVMCWRGGVIVTAAPDVFWLRDTNGDGKADVKEVLLTGLDTNSTSQLRANDPTLGPDGWIYLAGGLRGGKVSSPKRPGVILDTDKGDLRFKPDTGELELTEGKSQFGLAFDDAGNRFACMNRIQSQHAPLAARYVRRNPFLSPPGVLQNCPEITENTLMTRYTAGAARYYPISDNLTTADSHFGTYSAACAVHIYRGDALPEAYRGAAFSCDPTGNLVRGDRLEKVGGTFSARRIHEGTEALRSRDNWFRPVFIADGPDGALYIADMYRKVIEHPEYLPGDLRKHMDFEAGKNKGRIWRLSATPNPHNSTLDAAATSVAALIDELSSTIPWRRDKAFRLLVERNDSATLALLRKSVRKSDLAPPAVAKLRLLEIVGGVDEPTLSFALQHPQPAVRQNAVRLAEPSLATNTALRDLVVKLADDSDPQVRFQVALSLGEAGADEVVPALTRIAAQQASDRWTRAAILSALPARKNALALLAELARAGDPLPEGFIALAGDLGRQLGSGIATTGLVSAYEEITLRLVSAPGGMVIAANLGFAKATGPEFRRIALSNETRFTSLLAQARSRALAPDTSAELRVVSVELLAFDDSSDATTLLSGLLGAAHPREVQRAAARALLQPSRVAALPELLAADRWNSYTPGVRMMLLDRMVGGPEFAAVLLDAIQAGSVPVSALTSGQRDQLRRSKIPELKSRAEKLLAAPGGHRENAFTQAMAVLQLSPAPANGRAVFEKSCAACHRFNQQGVAVGPDLFDIRQQPKESILYHLIIPEAEIAPNFVNYECELKDGRTLSGLLASENSSGITLRMAQGVEETVARSQIARLTASRLSLMPQELEKAMTPQELADLLAYLKGEQ